MIPEGSTIAAPGGNTAGGLKPTLGLGGVTINAMALIAPGAFLWTTYESQCAFGAIDMWASVAVATFIALLTASCYATLASKYPQAGAGSSYFYAEAAFLEKDEHSSFKFARIAKLLVGCAAHLYYWVYPGVMVSFMGTLIVFIGQVFNPNFASAPWQQMAICVVFALITGGIALMGVTGSTMANVIINVVQIVALIVLTILAIMYRNSHPLVGYVHHSAGGVLTIHNLNTLLFQTTIAILLVVGFESATALAAEAKNPQKDIPRGVVLSLVIQAVIFYFFEYFGANYFVGDQYAGAVDANGANFSLIDTTKVHTFAQAIAGGLDPKTYAGGKLVFGTDAAAVSSAPIGDFSKILGDTMLHGHGQTLELVMAATVVAALVGTALSCLATGARVTYAMGQDDELPGPFGFLHGKFNTPHIAVGTLTIVSAILGAYGVLSADHLIQITLMSNLGTFLLYGLTCIATFIAFSHIKDANVWTTKVIPILGIIMNFGLMLAVFYFAFAGAAATPATKVDTKIALGVSIGFIVLSFAYLIIRSMIKGEPMLLAHDHKEQIAV